MTPNNLKIYAQIQAKIVEVEGMKACNAERLEKGLSVAYSESCFYRISDEIIKLAESL